MEVRTNVRILDVNQQDRTAIARRRIGERNRQKILQCPEAQISLRKHIAYGLPIGYIASRFGLTETQTWDLIKELEII